MRLQINFSFLFASLTRRSTFSLPCFFFFVPKVESRFNFIAFEGSKDRKTWKVGEIFKMRPRSMDGWARLQRVKINYPGKSWNRRQEQRCFARERGGELDGKVLTLHPRQKFRTSAAGSSFKFIEFTRLRVVRLHAPSHDCNAISISK